MAESFLGKLSLGLRPPLACRNLLTPSCARTPREAWRTATPYSHCQHHFWQCLLVPWYRHVVRARPASTALHRSRTGWHIMPGGIGLPSSLFLKHCPPSVRADHLSLLSSFLCMCPVMKMPIAFKICDSYLTWFVCWCCHTPSVVPP